jgi:hypothetical protein
VSAPVTMSDARKTTRTVSLAPIAGIPFVHHVAQSLDVVFADTQTWSGSAPREDAVVVTHELGGADVSDLESVVDSPPWSTYYRDPRGGAAARFHAEPPWVPAHVLRTVRRGYEYGVTYEPPITGVLDQRNVELALTTFVLADRGRGVLAHGCGFALPSGTVVLSPGISGAGKSTLARLVRDHAHGSRVLNDDRVILTRESAAVRAWGAPWPGSEGIANPIDGPLGALAFIRHEAACGIREVSTRDAARRLYRTLALPLWSAEAMADALDFIETRLLALPLFEISYPATPEAGRWIADTLAEQLDHGR